MAASGDIPGAAFLRALHCMKNPAFITLHKYT